MTNDRRASLRQATLAALKSMPATSRQQLTDDLWQMPLALLADEAISALASIMA